MILTRPFAHLFCPDTVITRGHGSGEVISAARQTHLESRSLYKRKNIRFDSPRFECLRSRRSGFAGAMSAFLNGHFLGSAQGTAHSQDGIDVLNVTYTFNLAYLVSGDNGQRLLTLSEQLGTYSFSVLTVYHDSTGMNQNCESCGVSSEIFLRLMYSIRQYQRRA